jgi:hypothetical protein
VASFHIEEVCHEMMVRCIRIQLRTSLGKLVAEVVKHLHLFVEESAIYIVVSKAEPSAHVSKLH